MNVNNFHVETLIDSKLPLLMVFHYLSQDIGTALR